MHWTDTASAVALGKDATVSPPRNVLRVFCDGCRKSEEKLWKPRLPVEAYANFFRNAGWKTDSAMRTATCPSCQETPKVTDISAAALKRQRQMFDILNNHFDVESGAYDPGFSDASIAERLGLAETAVSKAREAAYGPLKVSPEILQAATEIEKIKAKFEQETAGLKSMIADLERETSRGIGEVQSRLSAAMRKVA